jgi:hypothetical protein
MEDGRENLISLFCARMRRIPGFQLLPRVREEFLLGVVMGMETEIWMGECERGRSGMLVGGVSGRRKWDRWVGERAGG